MDLTKHTLNLRAGDMKTLREYFPKKGASVVIRELVAKFIDSKLAAPLTDKEIKTILEE